MSLLSALQFSRRSPKGTTSPLTSAAPAAPSSEGWHPDLSVGTLRWHGPGGVPTERLARWHD